MKRRRVLRQSTLSHSSAARCPKGLAPRDALANPLGRGGLTVKPYQDPR
ncbi:MAG: hypothetical protein ACFCU7_06470 [Pleurocapsa sp.]